MRTIIIALERSYLYKSARNAATRQKGDRIEARRCLRVESLHPTDRRGVIKVVLSYKAGTRYIRQGDWEICHPYKSEIPVPTHRSEAKVKGVPRYYKQTDNYRDSDRTCYSSSAAMLLSFHKPDAIKDDDEYLRRVFEYGDTTRADVQLRALQSFGLDATFSQTRSIDWLKHELSGKTANPVCLGILHQGPAEAPSGSGHWIFAYGWDWNTNEAIVHDPWYSCFNDRLGEYWSDRPGKSQRFAEDVLRRRWTVEGPSMGWCLYLEQEEVE